MKKYNKEFLDKLMLMPKFETHCECCGRFAKVYKRTIGRSAIKQLIKIYRQYGTNWVHSNQVVTYSNADFGHAKYWGLVELQRNENFNTRTSGFWRLTDLGVRYLEDKVAISKYVLTYGDEVQGVSQELLFISETKFKNFNYQELMSGVSDE